MELFTGKAKAKFELYYFTTKEYQDLYGTFRLGYIDRFYLLPLSMQWGVVLDFADSLGYYIEIYHHALYEKPFGILIEGERGKRTYADLEDIPTRKEAQLECIKQLNVILNK